MNLASALSSERSEELKTLAADGRSTDLSSANSENVGELDRRQFLDKSPNSRQSRLRMSSHPQG
ncbi:MAG: hypothetical protein AB8B50_13055, partial [Pirellulaceae bacterium]